jgi:hypothetical protein
VRGILARPEQLGLQSTVLGAHEAKLLLETLEADHRK